VTIKYTAYFSRRTGARIAADELWRYKKIRRVRIEYERVESVSVRRGKPTISGQPVQRKRGVRGKTPTPIPARRKRKPKPKFRRATAAEIRALEEYEAEREEQREALADLFRESRARERKAKAAPIWTDARQQTVDGLQRSSKKELGAELWDEEMREYVGLGYPPLAVMYHGPADKRKPKGDLLPFLKDRAWSEDEMSTRTGNQFYLWVVFKVSDDVSRYIVRGKYHYTTKGEPPAESEGRRLSPAGYAVASFPWRYEPSKASAKQSLTPREAYAMLTDRQVEQQADGSAVTMPLWEVAMRRYIERTSGAKVRGVKLLGFTGGL
jgi:hypothetical protein